MALNGALARRFVEFCALGALLLCFADSQKLFLLKRLDKVPTLLRRAYTMIFVIVGWLIFYFKSSVGGIGAFATYFSGMLGGVGIPFANREFMYTLVDNFVFMVYN